jgi:hypothetical protein
MNAYVVMIFPTIQTDPENYLLDFLHLHEAEPMTSCILAKARILQSIKIPKLKSSKEDTNYSEEHFIYIVDLEVKETSNPGYFGESKNPKNSSSFQCFSIKIWQMSPYK